MEDLHGRSGAIADMLELNPLDSLCQTDDDCHDSAQLLDYLDLNPLIAWPEQTLSLHQD